MYAGQAKREEERGRKRERKGKKASGCGRAAGNDNVLITSSPPPRGFRPFLSLPDPCSANVFLVSRPRLKRGEEGNIKRNQWTRVFRPVLNGRSIIQMIDPARDFRGMGRQVTRTGRHVRVMFSSPAPTLHPTSIFEKTIHFNHDFYAFRDTDTLFPPPPSFVLSILHRTIFLDSSRFFSGLFCVDGNCLKLNCFAR